MTLYATGWKTPAPLDPPDEDYEPRDGEPPHTNAALANAAIGARCVLAAHHYREHGELPAWAR